MADEKEKRKEKPQFTGYKRWAVVIVLALAYGIGTRALFGGIPAYNKLDLNVVSLSFMLGMPIGIGAIVAYFAGDKYLRGLVISVGLTAFVLGLTVIFAFEVWICVLMAAIPMLFIAGIFYVLIVGFVHLGSKLMPKGEKPKRMNAISLFVFLLIPYLFSPIEASFESPDLYRTVEDSILIQSSPEIVWENIIRMDTISSEEQFPTVFQMIGIPRPLRATLREEGLGQLRRGEFEYGLLFQEVITVWKPYEEIAFDIRVNHNSLESAALAQIGGEYLDIVEAGYRIEQLEDGQIRLLLHSRYLVTTSFNDYAAFWVDWVMHDFQRYVLRTVKARLEG